PPPGRLRPAGARPGGRRRAPGRRCSILLAGRYAGLRRAVMGFEHVLVDRSGPFTTITMNRPQRRNALSAAHLQELTAAFTQAGESDAAGIILAGNGPVFSAG